MIPVFVENFPFGKKHFYEKSNEQYSESFNYAAELNNWHFIIKLILKLSIF